MKSMTEEEQKEFEVMMDMVSPHIVNMITTGISNANRLAEGAYELKHHGKEYLQNMPDPRCMERLLWGNVYGHVIQAALANPNLDGTPSDISKDAIIYADLAVEAYNTRFPNANS